MSAKIIFVTGTDTGVGKTVFTALMLDYLRSRNIRALALKPFCSGGRSDARMLHSLQTEELRLDEVNPYWFSEPVAPLIAAREERRLISLQDVCGHIRKIARFCDILLVEGAGGLLVPLGEDYTFLDLMIACPGFVVIIARNKLGTLNQTLLTLRALDPLSGHNAGMRRWRCAVVLMGQSKPDRSVRSNGKFLRELGRREFVAEVPNLGPHPIAKECLAVNQKKISKTLARILETTSLVALFFAT